jgi:hypothetical protein
MLQSWNLQFKRQNKESSNQPKQWVCRAAVWSISLGQPSHKVKTYTK